MTKLIVAFAILGTLLITGGNIVQRFETHGSKTLHILPWLCAYHDANSLIKDGNAIYSVSPSLEAPNYCLCIQSNSAGFSFVNTGKQVHLKHTRRHFERNLVKDRL